MKTLVVLMLVCGAAFAETKAPDKVDRVEYAELQRDTAEAEALDAKIKLAQADLKARVEALKSRRAKFVNDNHLGDGDEINPKTGEIKRAAAADKGKK